MLYGGKLIFCPSCGETVEFPTRTFLPRPIDANDPFLKEKKKNMIMPRNLKSSIHSAYGGDTLFPSANNKKLGGPIEIEKNMSLQPSRTQT